MKWAAWKLWMGVASDLMCIGVAGWYAFRHAHWSIAGICFYLLIMDRVKDYTAQSKEAGERMERIARQMERNAMKVDGSTATVSDSELRKAIHRLQDRGAIR